MAKTVTGLNPIREQQLQERMVIQQSRTIERPLSAEISRAMKALAKGGLLEEAQIMSTHIASVSRILKKQYMATFPMFGNRVLEGAQKATALEGTPQLTQSAIDWNEIHGAIAVGEITGTTLAQTQNIVRNAVAVGLDEGLGEIEVAKNIQAEVRQQAALLSRHRARVIARTETHGAANAANNAAAEITGLPMKKQWVASGGERTRSDHRRADGQTVGLNESFNVGGASLMFAGDPSGPADQVINCRCVSVHIVI